MKCKKPSFNLIICILHFAFCIVLLSGCNPITRHKALTVFFDGVPSLPPPEELCTDYVAKMKAEKEAASKQEQQKTTSVGGSRHEPYSEKRCEDCHDKTKQDGLIQPKKDLCFVCHTDFMKGSFIHGPVAVGDCLICHLPHTANFPSLLKIGRSQICSTCHREKRLAAGLHDMVKAKNMDCADCHDPHSGNARFFLK